MVPWSYSLAKYLNTSTMSLKQNILDIYLICKMLLIQGPSCWHQGCLYLMYGPFPLSSYTLQQVRITNKLNSLPNWDINWCSAVTLKEPSSLTNMSLQGQGMIALNMVLKSTFLATLRTIIQEPLNIGCNKSSTIVDWRIHFFF